MIHLLMSHPGTHAVAHAAPVAALPLIFRRAIAAVRRKPAVPAALHSAGAPPALSPDDAWHGKTEPRGYPVLGNKMLSQVRAEQDAKPTFTPGRPVFRPSSAMDTSEFRALDAAIDAVLRPVNGRSLPDQPRQEPVPFGELNRKFSDGRPTPELLRQVLAGLKKLGTEREATYRGGWQ